jgi:hypothetical protein
MGLEPDESLLQEALQWLTQTVMELEAAEQVDAGGYERTPERKTHRNGDRNRIWNTRAGEIPRRIPGVSSAVMRSTPQAFFGWASILLRGNLPGHPAHCRRPSRCRGGGLRIQFDAARAGTGPSPSRAPGDDGVLDLKTCPLLR